MTSDATLATKDMQAVLTWAAERQAAISVSVLNDGRWCNLRSQIVRYDSERDNLQIVYPISMDTLAPPEISAGDKLGISFRRGHKKCILVCPVQVRAIAEFPDGKPVDTLVIGPPAQMRELQRRIYQRINVPADWTIACRMWLGGVPTADAATIPLCTGHVLNVSVGGILLDIPSEQDPRLGIGEHVGIEIAPKRGTPPLIAEAQYRHCLQTRPGRVGLGLQYMGLEHDRPGRASVAQIAQFVRLVKEASAS